VSIADAVMAIEHGRRQADHACRRTIRNKSKETLMFLTTWIRNVPVGIKVALAPAIAILCLSVVGAIGYIANESLSGTIVDIGEKRVPRIVSNSQLSERITGIHALVNQSLAWEGAGYKAEKIEALDKQILSLLNQYKTDLQRIQGVAEEDTDKKHLAAALPEFEKYAGNARQALDIKTGMLGNAASYMTTMEGNYTQLKAELDALVVAQTDTANRAVTQGRDQANRNTSLIFAAIGVALFATVAAAWVMTRMLVAPLSVASQVAIAVANGDLTHSPVATSTDATGQVIESMNTVTSNLSGIVRDIRSTADTINYAASEIAQGNNDLSRRTETQASSLEETAASMQELSSAVRKNAGTAMEATQMASSASHAAMKGGEVVSQVVDTMEDITSSSRQIADIIGVIDGIAFQTNILALNAAVEAARAGEQGRGFAVVASEVRALAGRSASAAKEIKALINASVDRVDAGRRLVSDAGSSMQNIVIQVKQVAELIEKISATATEQTNGIEQINQAIIELDNVTQQNAALVEEAAAAAGSMSQQATRLVEVVSVFKLRESNITPKLTSTERKSEVRRLTPGGLAPKASTTDSGAKRISVQRANDNSDDWTTF
jgi:methyl-accepting chemotaxis protein